MPTLLDVLALLTLALALAVGIRQGLPFTLGVLIALLVYGLIVLILPSGVLPVAVLVILGLVIGLGGGWLSGGLNLPRLSPLVEGVAGSVGGLAWGLLLAMSIWVSFPAQFSASTGTIKYPSDNLPEIIRQSVDESPFAFNLFSWAYNHTVPRKVLLPHLP